MSKVLFEVELLHSYGVLDDVCDFLTNLFNKDMNDFVSYTSVGLSKDVVGNRIDIYSLTEFIDECDAQERRRLIYKMLLDRMYPVVFEKRIVFLAELDCFRPGYITDLEAQEFTKDLYVAVEYLIHKVEEFIQKNRVYVASLDPLIRNDVRSLYRLSELIKLGIRDLTYKEQLHLQKTVVA